METAIYNLSVSWTHRARVFLSVRPDSKLRLDLGYPDDAPMQIEAHAARDLVIQFRAVMQEKFGSERTLLIPASAAEVESFQHLFREGRYALEDLFSHDRPSA